MEEAESHYGELTPNNVSIMPITIDYQDLGQGRRDVKTLHLLNSFCVQYYSPYCLRWLTELTSHDLNALFPFHIRHKNACYC